MANFGLGINANFGFGGGDQPAAPQNGRVKKNSGGGGFNAAAAAPGTGAANPFVAGLPGGGFGGFGAPAAPSAAAAAAAGGFGFGAPAAAPSAAAGGFSFGSNNNNIFPATSLTPTVPAARILGGGGGGAPLPNKSSPSIVKYISLSESSQLIASACNINDPKHLIALLSGDLRLSEDAEVSLLRKEVVRVFMSSTFDDTKFEQDAVLERALP